MKNKLYTLIFLLNIVNIASYQECNIKGLNKKEILKALFAAAKPHLGYPLGKDKLNKKDCKKVKKDNYSLDYFHNRCMHIVFHGDTMDTKFYNLANGENAAEKAIAYLLQK